MQYNQKNLKVQYFPGSHTGEAVANLVKEIASSFGIPADKILYCCTDNASNMELCVEGHMTEAPTVRIYCACHWLQLVVNDALKESGVLQGVERLKDYIAYVGKSSLASQRLEQIQKEKLRPNEEPKKLVKDVDTRWCSLYLMCNRAVALEESIIKHVMELMVNEDTNTVTGLTANDVEQLKYLTALLRPFYDATMALEGDKDASISVVFPQLQRVQKHVRVMNPLVVEPAVLGFRDGQRVEIKKAVTIAHESLPNYIKVLKMTLHHKLVERWGIESRVAHLYPTYVASTFLDHKYRSNKDIAAFKKTAFGYIQDMAIKMMKEERDGEAAAAASPSTSAATAAAVASGQTVEKLTPAQLAHLESMDDGEGNAEARAEEDRLSEEEIKTKVLEEIERLKLEKVSFETIGNVSSIDWWKSYRGSFPILARLAMRFLSIPASSASCERVFSQAGLTLTKLRTRLGVDTVANLMMIKYHHGDDKVYHTLKDWEELCEGTIE